MNCCKYANSCKSSPILTALCAGLLRFKCAIDSRGGRQHTASLENLADDLICNLFYRENAVGEPCFGHKARHPPHHGTRFILYDHLAMCCFDVLTPSQPILS